MEQQEDNLTIEKMNEYNQGFVECVEGLKKRLMEIESKITELSKLLAEDTLDMERLESEMNKECETIANKEES